VIRLQCIKTRFQRTGLAVI